MPDFSSKNIGDSSDPGLGNILRSAREELKISLEEAAHKLKIRKEYLLALEEEDFRKLPSGLYGRQFLGKYSRLLRLNSKKIIEASPFAKDLPLGDPFSQKIVRRSKFLVFPKIIRNIILLILFVAFIFYLFFYFRHLVSPPQLQVYSPDKNVVTSSLSWEVKGKSSPETEIMINDTNILSDQNGNFSQEVPLKSGLNTLTITAKKKYGRESVIQRQILVENKYEQP